MGQAQGWALARAPSRPRTCGLTPPSRHLPGHRRLPQGPGPSPFLPVESCLVASLERFHTGIQTNSEGGSRRCSWPGSWGGCGAHGGAQAGDPAWQPRSEARLARWGTREAELQEERGGPGCGEGKVFGRLPRGLEPMAPRTLPTPRRGQRPSSFGVRFWGSWQLGPRGQGAYARTRGPPRVPDSKPVSASSVGRLANTRSPGNTWLTVSGLWDFGGVRPWPGGW